MQKVKDKVIHIMHKNITSRVNRLYHELQRYRLHCKQRQRGIKEAQTRAKCEYYEANQEYFYMGEKSKE